MYTLRVKRKFKRINILLFNFFIVCTHLKVIFEKNFEKNLNVKLFLSFFDKNLKTQKSQ